MALRWKRQARYTGLRAIGQGNRGYELNKDGQNVASVSYRDKYDEAKGCYWVARCDKLGIPLYNSYQDSTQTLNEAKDSALEYVKKHIKKD